MDIKGKKENKESYMDRYLEPAHPDCYKKRGMTTKELLMWFLLGIIFIIIYGLL
jgi:hypothetical protein